MAAAILVATNFTWSCCGPDTHRLGIDLNALTLLDKDRNLNNSTGLNGSGLEYVSSSVALNARLGLSDLELNEQRRLNRKNAALVGRTLTFSFSFTKRKSSPRVSALIRDLLVESRCP